MGKWAIFRVTAESAMLCGNTFAMVWSAAETLHCLSYDRCLFATRMLRRSTFALPIRKKAATLKIRTYL
jgi:hypothetical protein